MQPDLNNLPDHDDIRRILLIRWSAMGDVVIATAVFEDIVRAFPGREIHLNTMPPWDRLFQDDPRFARVFSVDMRGREKGLRGIRRWLHEVRTGRYDLVIDLQCNDRSRLLLAYLLLTGSGIRYRMGTSPRFPYNIAPPPHTGPVQALPYFRAPLQESGIPVRTGRPALHVPARNRAQVRALQQAHNLQPGAYALFMPGCQAGGHLKRWGAERYAELATRLHIAGLARIVLIGAQDEMEECRRIEHASGAYTLNLCGRTEILDIVPLCEDACFVVANDTGTAHVASATGKPMIMICGPTDPRRVKPAGENVVALQADLPCINCYLKECSHHSCMRLVTPQMVFEKLVQMGALQPRA